MISIRSINHGIRCVFFLLAYFVSAQLQAQEFSALVSPPRFEDSAKPGSVYRNVIEISNMSAGASTYIVKTADFLLADDGAVSFLEGVPQSTSCRPWVALEAREVTVALKGKKRFRFEIKVPENEPDGECRFALLIEGKPIEASFSVTARIAVVVYLKIGSGEADLSIVKASTTKIEGQELPAFTVKNKGNAHGRLEGMVEGVDNSGKKFSFIPSNAPIMPGKERLIYLSPQPDAPDEKTPTLVYPVKIKGFLDWSNRRVPLEAVFDPD